MQGVEQKKKTPTNKQMTGITFCNETKTKTTRNAACKDFGMSVCVHDEGCGRGHGLCGSSHFIPI